MTGGRISHTGEIGRTFDQHSMQFDSGQIEPPGNPYGVDPDTLEAVSGRAGDTQQQIRDAVEQALAGKQAADALTEDDEHNGKNIDDLNDRTPQLDGNQGGSQPSMPMGSDGGSGGMPSGMTPGLTAPVYNIPPGLLQGLLQGMDDYSASNPDSSLGGGRDASQPDGLDPNGVSLQHTASNHLSNDQVHAVIDQALDLNGVPKDENLRAKWHQLLVYMGDKESGFNPNAVNTNPSDYNTAHSTSIASDGAGNMCSRGLWQCIPSTFAAHHIAGTSNSIYDPVASGAAAVHYILSGTADGGRVGLDGSGLEAFAAKRGVSTGGYRGY